MSDTTANNSGGGAPLPEHYVNTARFDPRTLEALTQAQERVYLASQWKLMWWKFVRHRLAVISGLFLIALYVIALFAEFFAPYGLDARNVDAIYSPPQGIHLFHEGSFVGPFVYNQSYQLNMDTLKREYTVDTSEPVPLRFFCKGEPYKMFGLISSQRHLYCSGDDNPVFLLGSDRLGRDVASRIVHGARISLTIGLVGVAFSFLLGS
jgi:peptide/nickel transport system permease protein